MRKVDELRNVIANQFACEYKTYDFGEICNAFIDGKRFVKGVFFYLILHYKTKQHFIFK